MPKCPFIPIGDLVQSTTEFRKEYANPPHQIPLDLERIIENRLRIKIVPIDNLSLFLKGSNIQIDAFFSKSLYSVYVDSQQYLEQSYRYRFSLAHELGHFYLHSNIYQTLQISSIEAYKDFQRSFEGKELGKFETQANIFAANLLVPSDLLEDEAMKTLDDVRDIVNEYGSHERRRIIETVSEEIHTRFGVSTEVLTNRLMTEGLIDLLIRSL